MYVCICKWNMVHHQGTLFYILRTKQLRGLIINYFLDTFKNLKDLKDLKI